MSEQATVPLRWRLTGQIHGLGAGESVEVMPVAEHEAVLAGLLREFERRANELYQADLDGSEWQEAHRIVSQVRVWRWDDGGAE